MRGKLVDNTMIIIDSLTILKNQKANDILSSPKGGKLVKKLTVSIAIFDPFEF